MIQEYLRIACPYKGEASYLHLAVNGGKWETLVWYYQSPIHERAAIEHFVSLYEIEGVKMFLTTVNI